MSSWKINWSTVVLAALMSAIAAVVAFVFALRRIVYTYQFSEFESDNHWDIDSDLERLLGSFE